MKASVNRKLYPRVLMRKRGRLWWSYVIPFLGAPEDQWVQLASDTYCSGVRNKTQQMLTGSSERPPVIFTRDEWVDFFSGAKTWGALVNRPQRIGGEEMILKSALDAAAVELDYSDSRALNYSQRPIRADFTTTELARRDR